MRFLILIAGLSVGSCFSNNLHGASPTQAVSGTSVSGVTPTAFSGQPMVTPDGQYVTFSSDAVDVTPETGLLPYFNVYLANRTVGDLSLISVSTNGTGGNDHSVGAVVSDDGRYVAFQSLAGNLAIRDTNGTSDVFLRDRVAGTTMLISRERSGWTGAGAQSLAPLISRDGRRVVFQSSAADLVLNDTNAAPDIFVYDRETGAIALVSINDEGTGSRAGASSSFTISSNGQWVAFVNQATSASQIYVRELPDGPVRWASATVVSHLPGFLGSSRPTLSADGSGVYFLAYRSTTTNLYRVPLPDGAVTLVAEGVQGFTTFSPSGDGRSVAYQSAGLVRVGKWPFQHSTVASVTSSGELAPGQEEAKPILSADGTKVTFLSEAGGLTDNPTNGLAQLYQRDLVHAVTTLVSVNQAGSSAGDLAAEVPAVSPDGRFVAFGSAGDIVANDVNFNADIFLRDLTSSQSSLISGRTGLGTTTPPASAKVYPHSVTADGRYVAYGTSDLGADQGDTNGVEDIYIADLTNGARNSVSLGVLPPLSSPNHSQIPILSTNGRRIAWVMVARNSRKYFWRDLDQPLEETRQVAVTGMPASADYSPALSRLGPALSPDGRWVAFEFMGDADTYEPGISDNNGVSDVILQDVLAGTNFVVSRSIAGQKTGASGSFAPLFSPNGLWLAFVSQAWDLVDQPGPGGPKLYLRDLQNNTTIAVSGSPVIGEPPLSIYYIAGAVFSENSQFLAYTALGSIGIVNSIGIFDLPAGIRSIVCSNCANPTVSGDGRLVAADNVAAGYNQRVLLVDRATGQTTIIGTNPPSGLFTPGSATREPVISRDGRYLVFLAERYDGATPASPSLYVRDLFRGLTMPLPVSLTCDSGNGPSYKPQLASDGRTLVFASFASDLMSGDNNKSRDVFVYRIGSADTDQDGLDDDWEMAYFNTLERNGSGDYDQDGHSDATEFRAGTDPTNLGSVLSAMLFHDLVNQRMIIQWNSIPGRRYDVQYKDAIGDAWHTLSSGVLATASIHSVVDLADPRPAQRYYRIMLGQ